MPHSQVLLSALKCIYSVIWKKFLELGIIVQSNVKIQMMILEQFQERMLHNCHLYYDIDNIVHRHTLNKTKYRVFVHVVWSLLPYMPIEVKMGYFSTIHVPMLLLSERWHMKKRDIFLKSKYYDTERAIIEIIWYRNAIIECELAM